MQTVQDIARQIVAREGGFVNDPDDPGGATKYGVTIGTMRRLRIDVDRDGDVDVADVRRLTRAQAEDIFLRHYYYAPNIQLLPEPLRASVFDMQVNAGTNAVRILQRLLTKFDEPLAADGVIGPKTAAAAGRAYEKAGLYLVDAYGIARRDYYFGLADRRRSSRKYARTRAGGKGGWIKRAEEFIRPRFHLTDAQFQERVSQWG